MHKLQLLPTAENTCVVRKQCTRNNSVLGHHSIILPNFHKCVTNDGIKRSINKKQFVYTSVLI
jgi:hypothetical protein